MVIILFLISAFLALGQVQDAIVFVVEELGVKEPMTTDTLRSPLLVLAPVFHVNLCDRCLLVVVHTASDEVAEIGSTCDLRKRDIFFGYRCTTSPFKFFFSTSVMLWSALSPFRTLNPAFIQALKVKQFERGLYSLAACSPNLCRICFSTF